MSTLTQTGTSYVAGAWAPGGMRARRVNPASPQEVVIEFAQADEALLEQAVAAAAEAQPEWDRLGIIARGRVLATVAALIRANAEHLAATMTAEHGKTLGESRLEVLASAETFEYHAASSRSPLGVEYPSSHPEERIFTVRRPLGVLGVITPWNFPLQIPAWKIAPALLHGNTVVWKPASLTVGVAVQLAEIMTEAGVPDGVANLVLGPGSIGSALVASPEVAGVTFTGSVEVGHQIRQVVCGRGAKLQMELGGHNAALVLPDADPELAAQSIVSAAMGSTGQKCTATRRVILVGDGHEELLERLAEKVNALVVGNGTDPLTDVGPIVSDAAQREVLGAIGQALAEGAEIVAQSSVPDTEGYFVPPTLLAGPPSLAICREEVFGPVATILRSPDLDSAIALANSTRYGLTASVFTGDERAVRKCMRDLEAGLVKVNAPSTGSELHAPFGGLKDSTFAGPREQNSESAAAFFTQQKTAYVRLAPEGDRA